MHIVWVKTELLHPVDKGGRIRTYNMLRELNRQHRVTYLTLDDGDAAPDALARATEYCERVIRVPFRTAPKRSPRFWGELLGNLVSSLPYAIAKYRSVALEARLRELVAAGDVDVVVCDFLAPSLNVPGGLGCPTVLFQHNVEAKIWERHAEVARSAPARFYMREQWRRMRAFEAAECRRFDRVITVSPEDRDEIRSAYGATRVDDVPTGVDTAYFRPSGSVARQPYELVFTGSMDWLPNEDGVDYFVGEILPRIRARLPQVTLAIVGRSPSERVRALAASAPGVRVTGSVPDVRPYIEAAAAFVVPLRIGGGTRLKVFEAMGMETPIVATTIGAEGLPVRHDDTILLADDPDAFADAVVSLLENPARARAIAQRAAADVRSRFGWDRVAEVFARLCADAAHVRPGAGTPGIAGHQSLKNGIHA